MDHDTKFPIFPLKLVTGAMDGQGGIDGGVFAKIQQKYWFLSRQFEQITSCKMHAETLLPILILRHPSISKSPVGYYYHSSVVAIDEGGSVQIKQCVKFTKCNTVAALETTLVMVLCV